MIYRSARVFICIRILFLMFCLSLAGPVPAQDKPFALPDGQTGDATAQKYTNSISGGTPPYHWIVSGGKLPTGLTLSEPDGTISGNLKDATAGSYPFELTVTDSSNPQMKVSQQYTLMVKPAPMKITPGGSAALAKQMAVIPGGGAAQDQTNGSASGGAGGVNGGAPAATGGPLKLDPDTVAAGNGDVTISLSGPTDSTQKIYVNCKTLLEYADKKAPSVLYNPGTKNFTIKLPAADVKTAGPIMIGTTANCSSTDAASLAVLNVSGFNDMAPLGEALVGVDVSAASSANPSAVFLGLGIVDIPFRGVNRSISQSGFGALWVSGELGLKGMAQPGAVSGALSSGYFATAVTATPDKIVQSADMSVHFGIELHKWAIPISTFDVPNSKNAATNEANPSTTAMLSVIGGGGAITPLSLSQANPQVFEATPQIINTFNGKMNGDGTTITFTPPVGSTSCAPTTCFVTFTPADRTRFYRYYDAGLRLKLYSKDYPDGELRFPAILDLTIGQSEYVTGGNAHGPVLHVGGSFPIPRADSFYGFGSFDLGLARGSGNGPQLFFIPVPSSVTPAPTPTSSGVVNIITGQPNRDRYSFGFGVDLFHLFAPKKTPAPGC
jgi:hypothetical protein